MKKRVMPLLLSLVIILSLSTQVSANSKYRVNTPKPAKYATTRDVVLISGRAPRDTRISIDVYGAVNTTGKNYNLANLPKDRDYVLISRQNLKCGPVGFGEEVKLIKGINKIIVTFKVKGVEPVQKIVYYYNTKDLLGR